MCAARPQDSGTTGRDYVKYQVSAELYFSLGTCVFYFIPEMKCDLELTVAHECKPSTALLTGQTFPCRGQIPWRHLESLCSTLCGSTCRGSQYPHKRPLEEVLKQLPTNAGAERRFSATREKRLTHLSVRLGVSMSLQVGSNRHKKTGRAEDVAQLLIVFA